MKKPKFKPRRISDEMPPLHPTAIRLRGGQLSMRNCWIEGFGTGLSLEDMNALWIENLVTRRTYRPIAMKKTKKAYLRGLDFQR